MICDLVRTVTADGLRLDGAWHSPGFLAFSARQGQAAAAVAGAVATSTAAGGTSTSTATSADRSLPVDTLICLHGVGSNFYGSSLYEALTPAWLAAGLNVLWVNTRGHDLAYGAALRLGRRWMGAAFETVDDCRLDVAAWIELAKSRGAQRIGLVGHSLGGIKAVYSQANEPNPSVARLIALSPPRLSYLFFKNDPNGAAFFDAITTAQKHLDEGKHDTIIRVQYPFPLLITAGGYVEKYGPAERYNIVNHVSRLVCPSLFAYGELEIESGAVSFAGVPDALRAAARPDQSLAVAVIPAADHNYSRAAAALSAKIAEWLV